MLAFTGDRRTGLPSLSVWAKRRCDCSQTFRNLLCFIVCFYIISHYHYLIIMSVRDTDVRVQRTVCCITVFICHTHFRLYVTCLALEGSYTSHSGCKNLGWNINVYDGLLWVVTPLMWRRNSRHLSQTLGEALPSSTDVKTRQRQQKWAETL